MYMYPSSSSQFHAPLPQALPTAPGPTAAGWGALKGYASIHLTQADIWIISNNIKFRYWRMLVLQ